MLYNCFAHKPSAANLNWAALGLPTTFLYKLFPLIGHLWYTQLHKIHNAVFLTTTQGLVFSGSYELSWIYSPFSCLSKGLDAWCFHPHEQTKSYLVSFFECNDFTSKCLVSMAAVRHFNTLNACLVTGLFYTLIENAAVPEHKRYVGSLPLLLLQLLFTLRF